MAQDNLRGCRLRLSWQ